MTNTVSVMMSLIADTVLGTAGRPESQTAKASLTDEELQKLDRLSDAHDLSHLVGSALLSQELIRDEEWKARFKKQIMKAVFRCEKNEFELERLKETLSRAQIPFVPLKGSVLRAYYPEPWMRTSCDIDILVHEEDLERAGAVLCEKLSYQGGEKNYHDVAFYAPGGVHLELHYTLCESKAEKDFDPVLESAWERAFPACEGALNRFCRTNCFTIITLPTWPNILRSAGAACDRFWICLCFAIKCRTTKRSATRSLRKAVFRLLPERPNNFQRFGSEEPGTPRSHGKWKPICLAAAYTERLPTGFPFSRSSVAARSAMRFPASGCLMTASNFIIPR